MGLISSNIDMTKYLVEQLPNLAENTIRYTLASSFILTILVLKEAGLFIITKKNLPAFLYLTAIGLIAVFALIFPEARASTTISKALFVSANPFLTILMSSLILKNPIRYSNRIGMFFCLTGVMASLIHG